MCNLCGEIEIFEKILEEKECVIYAVKSAPQQQNERKGRTCAEACSPAYNVMWGILSAENRQVPESSVTDQRLKHLLIKGALGQHRHMRDDMT